MAVIFEKTDDIKKHYGVTKIKTLPSGHLAIRKGGFWLYFNWDLKDKGYVQTGSSLKLAR